MKKIFLDTNVILDWALERDGFAGICELFKAAEITDNIRLYTSFLSVANFAYVIRKNPNQVILDTIKCLMHYVNVMEMNDFQLHRLDECKSPDIEDRMQILCAEMGKASIIITGNTAHFKEYTEIPVMTIREFLGES